LGGYTVTGFSLSGTAHVTLKALATPFEGLDVETFVLWSWFTEDRDVSGNTIKFNQDARDLGIETGLYVTYHVLDGFKVFARGAVFFPGKGYLVEQDTRNRGTLAQAILGAMRALKESAVVDDFTTSGKPKVEALEAVLGFDVDAAERDALWKALVADAEVDNPKVGLTINKRPKAG